MRESICGPIIYKSGNKQEPLNNRQPLTSVMYKLCEKVINRQWVNHLERDKIINESQFELRQGKSCVTTLICYNSKVGAAFTVVW